MSSSEQPIIFMMGPTASGKTDLAFRLVDEKQCEIISVDSAMIYRTMDIGTAKPDAATLKQYPHHLVDILDPAESYSAAQFRQDALTLIEAIHARGKVPLLVGGTMLYYRALEYGLSELPPADEKIRVAIESEAANHGWEYIHQQLQQVDPESAQRIHPNDPQRLQRALEVYRLTNIPMSEHWHRQQSQQLRYPITKLALAPEERSTLHQRIEQRFDWMLEHGFIEEVEGLRQRGDLHLELPSIRCVGYRQIWQYLDGEFSLEEARLKAIAATRQLAKRQFTWLRGEKNLRWFDALADNLANMVIKTLESQGF